MKTRRTIIPAFAIIFAGLLVPVLLPDGAHYKAVAGILRWTRTGPTDPGTPSNFVQIWERALVTSASGLSVTIGDYNAIYVGTNGRGIFKSMDNGNTWATANIGMDPSFNANFLAMCWRDSAALYAANATGIVYESIDSAMSWKKAPGQVPGTLNALAVHPWDPRVVFAGLIGPSASGIYKTRDSGKTWFASGIGLPTQTVSVIAIAPSDSNVMYAGILTNNLDGRGIYRSINAGLGWVRSDVGLPGNAFINSIAISAQDPQVVYAGLSSDNPGNPSKLFRTDNGGMSWHSASVGIPTTGLVNIEQVAVNPLDSNIAFAATGADGVFKTTDGGLNWGRLSSGLASGTILAAIAVDYSGNFVSAGGNGVWNWQEGSTTPIEPSVPFEPPPIPACPPSLDSSQANAPSDGLITNVGIISSSGNCQWQVIGAPSWIHVFFDGAASGPDYLGSGQLQLTIDQNPTIKGRIAPLMIAGHRFVVFQDGTRAPYPRFDITGQVTDRVGSPLPGIRMMLRGSRLGVTTTDSMGNYRFTITGISDYSYTVTPSKANVSFTPFSRSVNNPSGLVRFDFTTTSYEICVPRQFSPPGLPNNVAKIAYVRNRASLWTMNSNGSNKTQLVAETPGQPIEDPTWSLDGTYIAFIRDGDIYSVNSANGSGLVNLTQHIGTNRSPSWLRVVTASSSGFGIVFSSNRTDGVYHLYTMTHPGGGNITPLTGGNLDDNEPSWSPDGSQVVFVRSANNVPNIFAIDCHGNNLRQLTFFSNNNGAHRPLWSPDGKQILFVGEHPAPPTAQGIYVMNYNGSDQQPLVIQIPLPIPFGGFVASASWSPDGTSIVFSDGNTIYTVKSDGTNLDALPDDRTTYMPNWQWAAQGGGARHQKHTRQRHRRYGMSDASS